MKANKTGARAPKTTALKHDTVYLFEEPHSGSLYVIADGADGYSDLERIEGASFALDARAYATGATADWTVPVVTWDDLQCFDELCCDSSCTHNIPHVATWTAKNGVKIESPLGVAARRYLGLTDDEYEAICDADDDEFPIAAQGKPPGETRTWAELDQILQDKCGTSIAECVALLGGPKRGLN